MAENPTLLFSALVFTIIAGVVAVAAFGFDLFDRFGSHATVLSSTTSAPAPSTATMSVTPSSVTSASAGRPSPTATPTCLDHQGGAVDCREPHRYEKLTEECSVAGMLKYMAGRAGRDVVLADLASKSGFCVIDSKIEVSDTAAGTLASANDDAWRRCVDNRRDQLVPCDHDHDGEYIATGESRKASQSECEEAAASYLRTTLDNVSDLLRVRVIEQIDREPYAARCVIEVRGSQPLTASVSDLGVSPVPIRR